MLSEEQKQFYRDQLRSARNVALADAEGFMAVVHTLELMGQQLVGKICMGPGEYKKKLKGVASLSSLAHKVDPTYHVKFSTLFDELKDARNDAVHQGAYARILTDHAVDITIILEDALMSGFSQVSQFMVRDVVEAKPWQPVSYVRQQMLKHSFSYLPIRHEETWKLIPEYSVAKYLRGCSPKEREIRLVTTIEDAIKESKGNDRLRVLSAKTVCQEKKIDGSDILKCVGTKPILVVDPDREDELVGILTAADIL